MRTITCICNNRLPYLKQALYSLAQCDTSGFDRMLLSVDAGADAEMRDFVSNYRIVPSYNPLPVFHYFSPVQLRTDKHGFMALSTAFDTWGSDLNVHVEEDVVVSPDALRMAIWYSQSGTKAKALCLHGSAPCAETAETIRQVYEVNGFGPFGWATTRSSWEALFKPHWFTNLWADRGERYGWDWSINYHFSKTKEFTTLCPVVNRATTIGREGGVNMGADFWDREFAHVTVYQGYGPESYTL